MSSEILTVKVNIKTVRMSGIEQGGLLQVLTGGGVGVPLLEPLLELLDELVDELALELELESDPLELESDPLELELDPLELELEVESIQFCRVP